MLILNIHKYFLIMGIDNPVRFLVSNGINEATASKYVYRGFKGVSLKMLAKFCMIFNCLPNDILEWQPEKPEHTKYKLMELTPVDHSGLKKLLSGVPPSRALEFAKKVEEVKKEFLSNN